MSMKILPEVLYTSAGLETGTPTSPFETKDRPAKDRTDEIIVLMRQMVLLLQTATDCYMEVE